jgi:hypothetical protein
MSESTLRRETAAIDTPAGDAAMDGMGRLLSLGALELAGRSDGRTDDHAWRELHRRPDAPPLPEVTPAPAASGRAAGARPRPVAFVLRLAGR